MITKDQIVFEGYRNIVRRDVTLPNGVSASYDIVSQKHESVVVFVWDRHRSSCTLIQEYHPGVDRNMFGTVAGMFERDKHSSPLHAAQCELEEEVQLRTSCWYPLLDTAITSIPLDKYSNNKFWPYLAIDCEPVLKAKPMDEDECIVVEREVSYDRLMQLLSTGQMNMVSAFTVLLAMKKLKELGVKTH